ncbi:hypothetical protein FWJ25_04635 [Marinobacter salinexigens]|uniref:Uncharacterized protein n=1 Tax=Marinobacter salinexigens TaxID=2919747 RepID=A0A5B0VKX8_9GAMM|nr:hypothetical protein [Marinobacter salinexigens]KAA1174681.1 hypothetical protein FWJ25_04635 [Marinobacter salinexigens]
MGHQELRIKHKAFLVESAFRMFRPEAGTEEQKNYWVDRLLDGHDLNDMINELKSGFLGAIGSPSSDHLEARPEPAEKAELGTVGEGDYSGSAIPRETLGVLRAGMPETVPATIENRSSFKWASDSDQPINVAYHWLDEHGDMLFFEGNRTSLKTAIMPGQSALVDVHVVPPAKPGKYRLMLTLVHEGTCWFEDRGFSVSSQPVDVEWCLPTSTNRVLEELAFMRTTSHGEVVA